MIIAIIAMSAVQTPLQLVCGGAGTANKMASADVSGDLELSIDGTRQQEFRDQVDVRLFSGDDRIRLPRTMLPMLRGGQEGWFKLKNVKITDRAITARAAINLINSPSVHIDRLTGSISISGTSGDYAGVCQPVAADAKPKF